MKEVIVIYTVSNCEIQDGIHLIQCQSRREDIK